SVRVASLVARSFLASLASRSTPRKASAGPLSEAWASAALDSWAYVQPGGGANTSPLLVILALVSAFAAHFSLSDSHLGGGAGGGDTSGSGCGGGGGGLGQPVTPSARAARTESVRDRGDIPGESVAPGGLFLQVESEPGGKSRGSRAIPT